MQFVKNKTSLKYFCLSGVVLLFIYSNFLANFLTPIFDNIYYGNLVDMFTAISSALIWGLEIVLVVLALKKFNIQIFTAKENKGELKLWKVWTLFAITLIPMLIVSACIGWKVKIVYSLGVRVTVVKLLSNVCEILAYSFRLILMIMFIACVQNGFEMILKCKIKIPYGAILALLTFGLVDFFVFAQDLRAFYLFASFLFGIIYLVADKKFSLTWLLSYLIFLL